MRYRAYEIVESDKDRRDSIYFLDDGGGGRESIDGKRVDKRCHDVDCKYDKSIGALFVLMFLWLLLAAWLLAERQIHFIVRR